MRNHLFIPQGRCLVLFICPLNFGSILQIYFENDLLLLFSILQVQRISWDRPPPDNSTS